MSQDPETVADLFSWMSENSRADLPEPHLYDAALKEGYDGQYLDYVEEFDGAWSKDFDAESTLDMLIPTGLDESGRSPLVHFIFSEEMAEGVIHGVPDASRLGVTSASEKAVPGFNYGYLVEGDSLPKYFGEMLMGMKCELDYGDVGFVLRAPHLRVWHRGDHEEQVILRSEHLNNNPRVMISRSPLFVDLAGENLQSNSRKWDLIEICAWQVHAEDGTPLSENLLSFRDCMTLAVRELDNRAGLEIHEPSA